MRFPIILALCQVTREERGDKLRRRAGEMHVWHGNYYALTVTERRHGARRPGALQHGGGDPQVWGGVGENRTP